MCIQRAARCSQASLRVAAVRRQRDDQKLREEEEGSESLSTKFAKLLEATRKQSASGTDIGLRSAATLPCQDQQKSGTLPAGERWEGQERAVGSSVNEEQDWSGSPEGTESLAATGSNTREPENRDDHHDHDDEDVEKQGTDGMSALRDQKVGLSNIDELNESEGRDGETAEQIVESDVKDPPPVAGDQGQVAPSRQGPDSGEDNKLNMQLEETPGDAVICLAAAADGDESRDIDRANPAALGPEATGYAVLQTGPEISPAHASDEEHGASQRELPHPSTFDNKEHDEVIIEYPTAVQEIAEGWEPHQDETGATYYFHPGTGATSWDLPSSTPEAGETDGIGGREGQPLLVPHVNGAQEEEPSVVDITSVEASRPVVAAGEEDLLPGEEGKDVDNHYADVTGEVADEWHEVIDPDSGSSYFYNPLTRQSTWAIPEGALAVAVKAAEAAAAAAAAADD